MDWRERLLPQLLPPVSAHLGALPEGVAGRVEEIRLRADRPARLRCGDERIPLAGGWTPTREDIARLLARMCEHSLYARGQEMAQGYITLQGGFRVGLAGQVTMMEGGVRAISQVSSLNIRVLREVKGCASALFSRLIEGGRLRSTLIISPPGQGKTTCLRDLARLASARMDVTIVDERSEIAGCYRGVPQLDVGEQTDVLDGCAKVWGLRMAIRSLSPDVLVTDEIGMREDALALSEAACAGITVVASAHGEGIEAVKASEAMRSIVAGGAFERYVLLGSSRGRGTVEEVVDGEGRRV